jgi:hypothetical protein
MAAGHGGTVMDFFEFWDWVKWLERNGWDHEQAVVFAYYAQHLARQSGWTFEESFHYLCDQERRRRRSRSHCPVCGTPLDRGHCGRCADMRSKEFDQYRILFDHPPLRAH